MPKVMKDLEPKSPRMLDNTRIVPSGYIYEYWCLPYLEPLV